jgi:hypothetical protein
MLPRRMLNDAMTQELPVLHHPEHQQTVHFCDARASPE